MSSPKFRAVATSLVLVGAAGLTAVSATAPAHAATPPIQVSISKNRVVTMPDLIQQGVNKFRITTSARGGSGFQLAMPADGYTEDEANRDFELGLDQGKIKPLKRFEANVTLYGGVGVTERKATLVVDLDPGTYWALDTHTRKAAKFFTFTVGDLDTGNAVPASPTIKAKGSTTWAKRPASIPNKGSLTFKNRTDQNHFIVLVKLKKGKDLQDFEEWFLVEGPPQGPPPVNFDLGLDSGVTGPGLSMTFDYNLPKGNYVLLCFWPDADMGGMPHAFMGMYRGIKLK